jgi:septal ring factor EnvC (AmiA/AmiB activator)
MEQFWKELSIGAAILIAGLLKVIYDLTVMMPKKNTELNKAKTDKHILELEMKMSNSIDNKMNRFKDKINTLVSKLETEVSKMEKENEHTRRNIKQNNFLIEKYFDKDLKGND